MIICTHTHTEPGYYEDGKFGIRIENVVVIVPTETKYGSGYLTMEPVTLVCVCLRACVCVYMYVCMYSILVYRCLFS